MLFLTMLAALAAPVPASPCAGPDARSEDAVRAAEYRWVRLLETRDAAGLACLLAPEFADTTWAGQRLTRTDVLAALPRRAGVRLTLTDLAVALHGDVAIVQGLNRQTNAAGKVLGVVRFTDIFLHRGGRWQAISAQETPVLSGQ